MAFLNQTFTAAELPQGSSYDPLPAGWYSAKITGAELRNTKTGGGQYIAVKYDITGPTHQGRIVFGNVNIKNQNPKAEEIGRQQLGEIMRAIGLAKVTDTDQLIGGSLQIKLTIEAQEGYEPQNNVKGFKSAGGVGSLPQPVATAAAVAPAKSTPPWAK